MINVGIKDIFSKLAARVTEARSGNNSLSVKIEDMNTEDFAIPVVPGVFGVPFESFLENAGSSDMTVDGSSTPVVFEVSPDADEDLIVSEFYIYGRDGNIAFNKFLGITAITNGLLIEAKASNVVFSFDAIVTTGGLLAFSSSNSFSYYSDASSDVVKAVREDSFVLKKSGTYGPAENDDYFRVTVRDQISAPDELYSGIRGVKRNV